MQFLPFYTCGMNDMSFQSYTDTVDFSQSAARVTALRAQLQRLGLDGFVIPRGDEHQNEYVPACAGRLSWLTGFAGSAGTAIVLADKAAIFVDGRYTLQVREQVDLGVFAPQHSVDAPPEAWISKTLKAGAKLGYDPWLHTHGMVMRLEKACKLAGATLVPVSQNPVDAVWPDRPAPPLSPVVLYPAKLAGESASAKLKRVQGALGPCDALLVSDAHAVAWLFNIRGGDVEHTPLPLAFALVPKAGKPTLFVDSRKLSKSVRAALEKRTLVAEPDDLLPALEVLGTAKQRVRICAATGPAKCAQVVQALGGTADIGSDPISLMKACKNAAELDGARAAHIRDGAAMVNFLSWFDAQAGKGTLTEISAARQLEHFRRATGKLKEISFPSIAGAGPNAAIPHYRVSDTSNRKIGKGIFLIDSGGQYEDGTTDITRTLCVGKPTQDMRDRFTRVLRGHIAIARAVFPQGTNGAQIDAFARAALWDAGLDFDHGTGHGVGAYLSVHEGPQRISKLGTVALQPGMILSNEPGYYKAGQWGIRIEALVIVEPREIAGAERQMLGFETITLAPIALALVDATLMSAGEIAWLNAYHARVRKALLPLVDKGARGWLQGATAKVG